MDAPPMKMNDFVTVVDKKEEADMNTPFLLFLPHED